MKILLFFAAAILAFQVHAQVPARQPFDLVNSPHDEQNPVVSPDGKTLFVTIGNHDQNIGGKKDPGDIWISRLIDGQWSAPVHAGPILNDRTHNAVAGISGDGSQLFLLGHYDASGNSARTQGISVSKNNGGGWSRPENTSIPYFQNKSTHMSGYISPDKGIFIFSADTYGTRGVEDIYVCFNEDGRWTEPKNVGSAINTQFQELSPSLSADGKTLYFSSNGRKGNGSFDVYYSTRLDDTWTQWSEPTNMGAVINTGGRELHYRAFPELGYALFTSNTNSDGYGDIKFINAPQDPKRDTVLQVVTVDSAVNRVEITRNELKESKNTVRVYGKVNNAKSSEPINAYLIFNSPASTKSVTASGANGFVAEIPAVNIYSIRIEAKGFVSAFEKLDIHTYEMDELEMNFTLQPVEVGTTVNLKSVLFERGTANLIPESTTELDLVFSFLETNPKVVIELSGHTDNRGVHSHNVRLSQQRVNKVKDYLVSKGISARRINGKGYGGTKPIASNETEESRMLNRRVEFTIKKF
jgi:outer membrane protein OmpA-like peptidoglycan-associated protein